MATVRAPNVSPLGRLDGTGLLEKGRDMLRKLLDQKPDDANLWMRLAELERSAGDLTGAARCYRRAAEGTGRAAGLGVEMRAIAAMLEDEPEALVGIEPRRVVPFLIRPLPLGDDDLTTLMDELRRSAEVRRQGKVVERQGEIYNPSIREALDRKLPPGLRAATMRALEPTATLALRALFPRPPRIEGDSHSVIDYVVGGGYGPHPDRGLSGGAFGGRVLTIVAYLDVDDESLSGGDLLIHDASGNGLTRLRPKTGMMVAFPSEAVHEVTILSGPAPQGTLCRRTTLAVWYEEAAA